MNRSARMLAGLGFLFVAWARCGTDGAKCNGIWRKSGNCPRRWEENARRRRRETKIEKIGCRSGVARLRRSYHVVLGSQPSRAGL